MPRDVTRLLQAWTKGDLGALDELTPLVYNELRSISRLSLRKERRGHTLCTTDLVHEAFARLIGGKPVDWQDRQHFFQVASRQMRRILTDYAKARKRKKRGAGIEPESFDEALHIASAGIDFDHLLALDAALESFRRFDKHKAELMDLRFFGGFSIDELAQVRRCSRATINRDILYARRWLAREMASGTSEGSKQEH